MAAVTGSRVASWVLAGIVLALFVWILSLRPSEQGRVPNAVLRGFQSGAVAGITVDSIRLIREKSGDFKSLDGRSVNQGAVREYLSAMEILSYQNTDDQRTEENSAGEIDGVVTISRREADPILIRVRRRKASTELDTVGSNAPLGWLEVDGKKRFWVDAYQADDLLDTSRFFTETEFPRQ